jgi:hypothetical protein
MAASQVARKIGHTPKLAREIGAVGCLASSLYDKYAGHCGNLAKILSGKKPSALHRVVSALQGRKAGGKSLRVIKSDYNGFKNYQTWNVAIYLKQNTDFSNRAKAFLKSNRGASYDQLIQGLGLAGQKTPDQIDWLDQRIDRGDMAKVLAYLSSSYRGSNMRKGIKSATQVDGGDEVITVQKDTPTGVSTAGETLSSEEIEGENSIKATEVSGGDTSVVKDVDNTGADGSLEADVDAGTEFNDSGYSFESGKIAALELPIEDENNSTQVLKMKEIASGVYVLDSAFVAPGAGRCAFLKGKDAIKVLSQGLKPSGVKTSVNRVLTLKGSGNGLFVKSSTVLGVVAIEAPINKGLRNAKYSVFSRTGVNLVNPEGFYIPSAKGPQMLIASEVSHKSVRRGTEKRDIFSEIEREYISYLKSSLYEAYAKNAKLNKQLSQAIESSKRRMDLHSRLLNKERLSAKHQVASSLADLQAVRVKSAEQEALRVFSSSQTAIRTEQDNSRSQAERNIQYLAGLM